MIEIKHRRTHVMVATALGALLCASFAPAQAGLLGGSGGSVARPLGANGQLGVQLSGSSSVGTPSPDAPLRQLSSGVQRGQAAAGDAAGQAKSKAESTGQAAAARSAQAASSAGVSGGVSAQGSAGTKR